MTTNANIAVQNAGNRIVHSLTALEPMILILQCRDGDGQTPTGEADTFGRVREGCARIRLHSVQINVIGKRLGHYRVVEKIGSGAFGEVYRAHDLHLERDVALKILRSGFIANNAARKQFRREALVLSKL